MALIKCPECGKRVSDKAAACPHCGIALEPAAQQTENSAPDTVNSAKSKPFNPLVIAIAGVLAAVAVGVIIAIVIANSGNPGESTKPPGDMFTNSSKTPEVYEVYMMVSCARNLVLNKHDVDILLDNKKLDTLPHGDSKDYTLSLSEGSHKLLFRLNDYPTSYAEFSLNVSEDMTVGFDIKCDFFDKIEVTRK